ncbi:MAG: hypothetical protein IPP71_07850 [Bacteroidetes bacterium]|nr:hypothetical protein [Bacteroidota bacterium]
MDNFTLKLEMKSYLVTKFLIFLSIILLYFTTLQGQQSLVKVETNKIPKTSLRLAIGYLQPLNEFSELSNNNFDTYNLSAAYTNLNMAGKATGGVYTSLAVSYSLHKHFDTARHCEYSCCNQRF